MCCVNVDWKLTNSHHRRFAGRNRLKADRKNPNKVYAYDSGGAWWNQWSDTAHFRYSADGGHTFTERTSFKATSPMVTFFSNTSMAVNPNVEGDVLLADGNALYHSVDAGATWSRFNDDAHQFGGIYHLAGDWNTYGRIYAAGNGRGVLYTN